MNRRRFLRQTAKGIAGIVAANVVPIPATGIIFVAEPSPFQVGTGETWKDINFRVHDLPGWITISCDLLADCVEPMQLMERSMMDTWNKQIERTLANA